MFMCTVAEERTMSFESSDAQSLCRVCEREVQQRQFDPIFEGLGQELRAHSSELTSRTH